MNIILQILVLTCVTVVVYGQACYNGENGCNIGTCTCASPFYTCNVDIFCFLDVCSGTCNLSILTIALISIGSILLFIIIIVALCNCRKSGDSSAATTTTTTVAPVVVAYPNQYPNQYPPQFPPQYPNQYPNQYPPQFPNTTAVQYAAY